MTTFYFKHKKYGPVPDSYNELTGKQLVGIAGLFVKELSRDVAKLKALKIVLNMSWFRFALVPADAKARMLQYIDWIFDRNTLTKQVLPSYRGFAGPKAEFDNLTIGEFHFTEMYYRQLVTGDDESAINKLVAVLYRVPKKGYDYKLDSDGDARRRFNANETEFYSMAIARWPMGAKLAVIQFYDGCRQSLLELYDEVFQGDKGEDNDDGMFGVIRGLSGDKYGQIDKVEALNIHTALLELSIQIKEAKEIEAPAKTPAH